MITVEEMRTIAERIAALSAVQIATSEAVDRAITHLASAQTPSNAPREGSFGSPTTQKPDDSH